MQSNKKTDELPEAREVLDSNYQEQQVAANWNTYDNLQFDWLLYVLENSLPLPIFPLIITLILLLIID